MSEGIDLEPFKQLMQHSDGECCKFFGYKIDEGNGLRAHLSFNEGQMSQADYFLIDKDSNKVQIIELTDLTEDIRDCIIAESILSEDNASFAKILETSPKKARKIIQRRIWAEVIAEFKNKWMGSIAILERYCRKDNYTNDLNYQMLIILKSNTDPKEIEVLRNKLIGMIGRVPICNTDNVELLLLTKLSKK
ncbi:hypothetical protein [Psychrobacter sp. LV10R520-6]|uniref:hypothetical protein n=1 Tax=Psychrobacter sp. LV10R520-6 TaxID=1415574 RepID=UPI0024C97307|nr:hypothetical protein [Psychrobacter sp. LV10R520-6]SNT71027.1 hypothetical protein SAMN04488491_2245 [Psychrobacter sp. LV10R520-6]